MASKRKRGVITLEKSSKSLHRYERQGKSQRVVADHFEVPKSTVGNIRKNKENIEKHVTASANPAFTKKCCIVRDAHFQKLDKACYLWFQQQRAKSAPVSSIGARESNRVFPFPLSRGRRKLF